MMRLRQIAWALAALLGLAGCSAHSQFLITDTMEVKPLAATKYEPHSNRVFLTGESLPPTAKYQVLAQLEVGKVQYAYHDVVLTSLAEGARKLGADAVVQIKTWYQTAGGSWPAPHGSGTAVKITEPASVDFTRLKGEWK